MVTITTSRPNLSYAETFVLKYTFLYGSLDDQTTPNKIAQEALVEKGLMKHLDAAPKLCAITDNGIEALLRLYETSDRAALRTILSEQWIKH